MASGHDFLHALHHTSSPLRLPAPPFFLLPPSAALGTTLKTTPRARRHLAPGSRPTPPSRTPGCSRAAQHTFPSTHTSRRHTHTHTPHRRFATPFPLAARSFRPPPHTHVLIIPCRSRTTFMTCLDAASCWRRWPVPASTHNSLIIIITPPARALLRATRWRLETGRGDPARPPHTHPHTHARAPSLLPSAGSTRSRRPGPHLPPSGRTPLKCSSSPPPAIRPYLLPLPPPLPPPPLFYPPPHPHTHSPVELRAPAPSPPSPVSPPLRAP